MTGEQIMAAVSFFVMLIGFMSGVWWRIEGKVAQAAAKGEKALNELAAHRLHVAETYVSKAGHREATEQIMDAIGSVRDAVTSLSGRIDGLYTNAAPKRRIAS